MNSNEFILGQGPGHKLELAVRRNNGGSTDIEWLSQGQNFSLAMLLARGEAKLEMRHLPEKPKELLIVVVEENQSIKESSLLDHTSGFKADINYDTPFGVLLSQAKCRIYPSSNEAPEVSQFPPNDKSGTKTVWFEVVQFIKKGWGVPRGLVFARFEEAGIRQANLFELAAFVSNFGAFSSKYYSLHALGSCFNVEKKIRGSWFMKRTYTQSFYPGIELSGGENLLRVSTDGPWKDENLFLGVRI